MEEIVAGLFHWTVVHEKIGIPVHSYYLAPARVLIDPMIPREGLGWFRQHGAPEHVLLTNRHHYRHSGRLRKAFGVRVHCHRAGLHEFKRGQVVEPFEFEDELPGGIRAVEVGVLCPEETALIVPLLAAGPQGRRGPTAASAGGRAGTGAGAALALGDSVIRDEDGELAFVPDEFMGDDPEGVKCGLEAAFRRLARERFDHLLMAHGEPIVGEGRSALKRFAK